MDSRWVIGEDQLAEKKDLHISIENVVASATLDQKIDLLAIMKVFRNVEYRPKQFPGLVFRLKRPKTATLIFGSWKDGMHGS